MSVFDDLKRVREINGEDYLLLNTASDDTNKKITVKDFYTNLMLTNESLFQRLKDENLKLMKKIERLENVVSLFIVSNTGEQSEESEEPKEHEEKNYNN